jgi:hypothetical protein
MEMKKRMRKEKAEQRRKEDQVDKLKSRKMFEPSSYSRNFPWNQLEEKNIRTKTVTALLVG